MMILMTNNDSLRRDDMRPAPVKKIETRLVKRYVIAYTSASGRRTSNRVYPRAMALKLAARLNRYTENRADAYVSAMMIRIEVES